MLSNSQTSPDAALMLSALKEARDATDEAVGIPVSELDRLKTTNIIPKVGGLKRDVDPNLTGNEKRRAYNFAQELARSFYDFAQKHKEDTKEKTLLQSQATNVKEASGNEPTVGNIDKNKIGFWAKLIAATIIIGILIWNYFGPIGADISKFITKLPQFLKDSVSFKGLFKFLSETKIGKAVSEFIAPISKLFTSIKAFFGIGTKATTEIVEGTSKLKGFTGILKAATSTIGKFLSRWIRRLPIIGGILGMVYAYKSFEAGNWVRGTVEMLSAVLSFSGVGLPISLILDGALLIYDLMKAEGSSEVAASSTAMKVGIGTSRALLPLLTKTGSKIGLKLGKVLKFIPFIGGLFNFASAYLRFQEGQWFRGTLEIIAGIAALSGVASPLAWVIDGALILSDLIEPKVGAEVAGGAAAKGVVLGASILPLLTKFGLKIGTKLLKVLKFIPVVGALANFALSYIRFKEGDWLGGIFELIAGIAAFIPGYGTAVAYIIDGGLILYDLLKSDKAQTSEEPKKGKSQPGVWDKLKSWVGTKLINSLWYTPGVSSLLYIGRGISKLVNGDFRGGLLDLASSLLAVTGGKLLVDFVLNALGIIESTEKTVTSEVSTSTNTVGIFDKLKSWVGAKFVGALWYTPGVSSLLYIGRGISKLVSGDFKSGLLDLASSLLALTGGKLLVDFILNALGLIESPEKIVTPEVSTSTSTSGIFDKLKSWVGTKLINSLWYIPGISSLLYIGRGISKLVNGDFKGGLLDLASSLLAFTGGKMLVDFVLNALGIIESTEKTAEPKSLKANTVNADNIISKLIEGVIGSLISVVSGIFNWIGTLKDKLANALEGAKEKVGSVYEGAKEKVGSVYEGAKEKVGSVYEGAKEKVGSVYEGAKEKVSGVYEGAKEKVSGTYTGIKAAAGSVYEGAKEKVSGTYTGIKAAAGSVYEGAKEKVSGTYTDATATLGSVWQGLKKSITNNPAIEMQQPKTEKLPVEVQVGAAPVIAKEKAKEEDNVAQNDLLLTQNGILLELLNTAKQQLLVLRKPSEPVIVNAGGSTSNTTNLNNAFSTSKRDSRSMLADSPYSFNANTSIA